MEPFIPWLCRWPFDAGETCAAALFAAVLAILYCTIPPDHSHHDSER